VAEALTFLTKVSLLVLSLGYRSLETRFEEPISSIQD
jgi:hypothetical protein